MYFIFYDISNNSVRTRVSKRLEKEGYDRIQFSVFIGRESPSQNRELWSFLQNICYEEADKLFVVSTSIQLFKQMKQIGATDWEIEYLSGEKRELFI